MDCGGTVGTFAYQRGSVTRYAFCTCPCREERYERERAAGYAAEARYRQEQANRLLGDTGLAQVAGMTLATFDPARIRSRTQQGHPFTVATAWLEAALAYGPQADYRDAASPPAALFFYSPGKGRGKTHLASGIAVEASARHRLVAVVQEHSYLERRWACTFEELEQVSALPGERAWLTVIDDIGQRSKAGASVSDAWYTIFNRRWLKAGWTIITSNRTPDELVAQGTINDATYSRLGQMTRKHLIVFDAPDARLETQPC